MKSHYITPTATVIDLEPREIITTSNPNSNEKLGEGSSYGGDDE